MSASTRTIQKPISGNSIFGATLMAVALLLAVVAITWGAMNLVKAKTVATPVQAPIFLDKGSRGELGAPLAAPAPGSILDRGGRGDLVPSAASNGGRLKDDNAFGSSYVGTPSSVGASSAAHATRTPGDAASSSTRHPGFRAQ